MDFRPKQSDQDQFAGVTLLLIDDYPQMMVALLRKYHFAMLTALNGKDGLRIAQKKQPELILLDIMMPGMDGFEICRLLKENAATRQIPVMFITALDSLEDKLKGYEAGGIDFISKPIMKREDVLVRIAAHLNQSRLQKKTVLHPQQDVGFLDPVSGTTETGKQQSLSPAVKSGQVPVIIGKSKPMNKIMTDISRLQKIDKTCVLILGECGTGKELAARAIHFGGVRAQKGSFVPVNCSAIPHELAESSFFGHVRGAFTGANSNHKGYFEQAHEGTLFFDEIGDMPMLLQAKLLRVLEDGMITPVGGERPKQVNVRIVAATNANLMTKIKAGTFRKDLYFRLACYNILHPPLRDHKEDVALLADHFLATLTDSMRTAKASISKSALNALENYHFPGNARELKNILERALICCNGGVIQPRHLHFMETGLIPNACLRQTEDFSPPDEVEKLPATDEEKILTYVQKEGRINNTRCRQLLGADYNRASYLLRKMNRASVLVQEGEQRATVYRLP
ncbi:MAG: sigma-54-dependent Fis family transcriptional regulator [Gammaproteobacteria bacterium]|nr:sigma-54-dependent Fis family transcriptional regulator [Gammaproteobacteria bacterium]